ncbi:hypothetical protein F4678DRAFT_297234 [Xylaria arbuscula]|nr:hypothetical protein F4678DRAFT_297234 [Xylaria arbuscula]
MVEGSFSLLVELLCDLLFKVPLAPFVLFAGLLAACIDRSKAAPLCEVSPFETVALRRPLNQILRARCEYDS